MPDIYSTITNVDPSVLERMADVLELRASDPQQQSFLQTYLNDVPFPDAARVLDIGCGTGAIARVVARHPQVVEVVGLDPSPVFIRTARELAADIPCASFIEGSGEKVPFPDGSFDVALLHTVLSHIPEPTDVLREAHRVLRAGGYLVVFDGDYVSVSEALARHDPLQVCIEAMTSAYVHDIWLIRRLPRLIRTAGFDILSTRAFGYVESKQPDYLLSLVDRGADAMAGDGLIGAELATAFKAEARRRVEIGSFYGTITYACVVASRMET